MKTRIPLVVLGAAAVAPALAADYVGTLKPPALPVLSARLDSLAPFALPGFAAAHAAEDNAFRLKLGYRYSPFLKVEGELNDFARAPFDSFSRPDLASGFRATGFGVDTVATLPVWRFSFYGRLGAYHGQARNAFAPTAVSLLGDGAGRTRWRYGLGMQYDFTKALGVRAEVERYAPLGTPLANDGEADLFSVGLRWRF